LPSPEAQELALLLARKAEGDESVLDRLLDDPDVPDDVLGFHVQQAVEKRLKAVLALRGIDFTASAISRRSWSITESILPTAGSG
jgi:hypothetical protein